MPATSDRLVGEALANHLADYHAKTKPVIDLFEHKEVVLHVDATTSIADICARLGLS